MVLPDFFDFAPLGDLPDISNSLFAYANTIPTYIFKASPRIIPARQEPKVPIFAPVLWLDPVFIASVTA